MPFQREVLNCNYDVIVLTETWLNEGITNEELFPPNYMVYRRDREPNQTNKSRGGGVLIAVECSFESSICSVPDNEVEQIWVSLQFGNDNYIVAALYIPPSSKAAVYEDLVTSVSYVLDHFPTTKVLLLGDFNLPSYENSFVQIKNCDKADVNHNICLNLLSTDSDCGFDKIFTSNDECEQILFDCTCFYDLTQYNNVSNANNVKLDLVFSNNPNVSISNNMSPLTNVDSHHPALLIDFFIDTVGDNVSDLQLFRYNFHRADYNLLNDYFESMDWSFLYCNNINSALEMFYTVLYIAIDLHVPKTRVSTLKYPNYFSRGTIALINKKNKAFKKYKHTRLTSDECQYKILRSQSKTSIKKDYDSFVQTVQNNILNNTKAFWSYIKTQRNTAGYPMKMSLNNVNSSDPKIIADLFADFFQSVFTVPDPAVTKNPFPCSINNMVLSNIEINSDIVLQKLIGLDEKKGAGPDDIPPIFVKNCCPTLTSPLSYLYRLSLDSGQFPNLWKSAYVTAIFKGGVRGDISNYRPISGLDCMAKVLESIVVDELLSNLYNSLSEHQHGFLPGRSCQSNLGVYSHYLSTFVDSGGQVDSIYFDFRKAFDRVDHVLLLNKLESFGVTGPLLSWVASYLQNRTQLVRIRGAVSREIAVTSGVPQGSHLGPILFLAFINDLANTFTNCHFLFYADDLKIFKNITCSHDCSLLQLEINKISEWCTLSGTELNISKCKIISFSRKKAPILHSYFIARSILPRVELINDLGIVFDTKLRFNNHINFILAKAFKMAGFIMRRCTEFSNIEVLKSLYFSLVRSHLEYCCIVWSPYYQTHIKRIERVQGKFVNFLLYKLGIDKNQFSHQDRLQMLNIDSLEMRRIFLTLMFGFKIVTNNVNCPELLALINIRVPSRDTRLNSMYTINRSRTDVGKNSVMNRIMHLFNTHIPTNFDFNCTPITFKNKLKSILANL